MDRMFRIKTKIPDAIDSAFILQILPILLIAF
jgi:hypothetical protein